MEETSKAKIYAQILKLFFHEFFWILKLKFNQKFKTLFTLLRLKLNFRDKINSQIKPNSMF